MDWLNILLLVVSALFIIVGIAGCIIPGLPGTPFSFVGLLIVHFTSYVHFPWWVLLLWGIVTVLVTLFDTFIPGIMTAQLGGTKRSVWGANVGIIVGIILGIFGHPWFIVILPFVLALAFEWYKTKEFKPSLKSASGAICGTLVGTIVKLFFSLLMTLHYILVLIF